MNVNKIRLMRIALIVFLFLGALLIYPNLPDKVASHWNASGEVDGYSNREIGAFFIPILTLVMFGILTFLPKIDPLKKNYAEFAKEYDKMILVTIAFMTYLYCLTVAFSLGYTFDMIQLLAPAFGGLFYYMSIVLSRAKQNWFVGIRTPWTLADENVWNKTHKIGSKLFKAVAIITIFGFVVPQLFLASIVALIASSLFLVIYSYFEFENTKRTKLNKKR